MSQRSVFYDFVIVGYVVGAIDRRQYEKSLTCMAEKMGMQAEKITEH